MKHKNLLSVFCCGAFFIASTASAATVYEYTGNTYNFVDNFEFGSSPLFGEYDNSMSVSGSFILEEALDSPSIALARDISSLVLAYSFFDGVNTLSNENSEIDTIQVSYAGTTILGWEVRVVREEIFYVPPEEGGSFQDFSLSISTASTDGTDATALDLGFSFDCTSIVDQYICSDIARGRGESQNNRGTWTSSSVVPIPAAVWLFGSALAGLGLLRRKPTA